jgi:hypothetical protein
MFRGVSSRNVPYMYCMWVVQILTPSFFAF